MTRTIFCLIVGFLFISCSRNSAKQPQPSSTPQAVEQHVPDFDGRRAFEYLTAQTDFGPRNPGSTEHEKCLTYLQNEMQKYAASVTLQPFTHKGYNDKAFNLTNVISSFNPKARTRILLIAHWDSRPRADQDPDPKKRNQPILGANDGASGVAILLEIARHLKAEPPPAGVDMLFTDGEDYGKERDNARYLLGTRYFARNLPSGFSASFGILLDMVGDAQLELMKEPYSMQYAPDVVELVWSTAKELGIYQFTNTVQNYVMDDHLPLNEVGIPTIDLIDFNYPDATNRYWHTTQDTPDKCSTESLEAVGRVLMHVIYHQPE
ncbi:MAG: M28 family peptidase [Ignavibacteriae bacterium]|nr:M28 family peptidase [Ignavibacteria bacterium]MBI3364976.1 M28 family peptidase [Ignavibacteriota bacterium]